MIKMDCWGNSFFLMFGPQSENVFFSLGRYTVSRVRVLLATLLC